MTFDNSYLVFLLVTCYRSLTHWFPILTIITVTVTGGCSEAYLCPKENNRLWTTHCPRELCTGSRSHDSWYSWGSWIQRGVRSRDKNRGGEWRKHDNPSFVFFSVWTGGVCGGKSKKIHIKCFALHYFTYSTLIGWLVNSGFRNLAQINIPTATSHLRGRN